MTATKSMKEQMSLVKDRLKGLTKDNINKPVLSPSYWTNDGEDHININRIAKTELGRMLTLDFTLMLKHPIFDKFSSVQSFWYYIGSVERDDRLRGLTGYELRQFAKSLTTTHVPNIKAMVMDANYIKIVSNNKLKSKMVRSVLPFDYYARNKTGVLIRPINFEWLLPGFEEIRTALKEDRQPDFSFLLDVKGSGIYDFVLPEVVEDEPDGSLDNILSAEEADATIKLLESTMNSETKLELTE